VAYGLADAAAPGIAVASALRERRPAPAGRGLRRNLRIAFRDRLTARERRQLRRAWSRHMAALAVDFCRMPRIRPDTLHRYIDVAELDVLRELLARGRGLLCVTGHLGVWEHAAHAVSVGGIPVTSVARPLRDPGADAAVNAIRRTGGQQIRRQRGALLPLVRALRRGELVGLLADEDVRVRPIFAPFLGTLAASSPAPAFLQRVTGAPIAVASCHRIGRERFRFHVWRVIEPRAARKTPRDDHAVTAEINDALSEAILRYPEQWLWGSRRFHTRPPGERIQPDGLPPPVREPDAPPPRPGA
jgi:KDO2-lipid IV(A) lauroyltransferase